MTDRKILKYKLVLDSGYWVLGSVMLAVGSCQTLWQIGWLLSPIFLEGGEGRLIV